MKTIHVNIAYQNMTDKGFDFLSGQGLHPEFYFCGDSIDRLEKPDIEKFKKLSLAKGFKGTLHAPFFDLNIGARDRSIRIVSFERLIWALETASMLDCSIVVIHPGYGPWVLNHKIDPWLKRAAPMLIKLVEHAQTLKLKLAFENIYDHDPYDLKKLLELVDSPNAGICFDLGHFNVFSKKPMQEWLDCLGEHIFECHLHDNDKSADQHLPLGDGNLDYETIRAWLTGRGDNMPAVTLELKNREHVMQSVETLKSWF